MTESSNSAQISFLHNDSSGRILEDRRIWVGNLDPRLSEYQLLKIVQKCGPVDKFDMLFHKSGPLAGQSRGYAFVTFATAEGAVNALEKLNSTVVANRPIVVRLAKNLNHDELDRRARIEIPALGTASRDGKFSKEEAIRAIENKLRVLERNRDEDLDFAGAGTSSTSTVPFIKRFQFNKDRDANNGQRMGYNRHSRSGPYNRNQRPKRK